MTRAAGRDETTVAPDLSQQQREIARRCQLALARRAAAEVAAAARLEREQRAAEVALAEARRQAEAGPEQARALLRDAQELLQTGQWQHVLNRPPPPPPLSTGGSSPIGNIALCVAQADQAAEALRAILVRKNGEVARPKRLGEVAVVWLIASTPLVLVAALSSWLWWPGPVAAALLSWWALARSNARPERPYARLYQAVAETQTWQRCWYEQVEEVHQRKVAESQDRYQQKMAQLGQAFAHEMGAVRPALAAFTRQVGSRAPSWSDPAWQTWTPRLEALPSAAVRLGELWIDTPEETLSLPAVLPFPSGRSLVLAASGPARALAARAVRSVLLRLLAEMPPGTLRLSFVGPRDLEGSVAPFLRLPGCDKGPSGGTLWAEPQHIERHLADVADHVESVAQTYLRDDWENIDDYNAAAGRVAIPYRVLVVLDFPVGFTDAAARCLANVLQTGPRCGVYAFVVVDTGQPLSPAFRLDELEQAAEVIAWDEEQQRLLWKDDDFRQWPLELEPPPDDLLGDRILTAVGEAAREAEAAGQIRSAGTPWNVAALRDAGRAPGAATAARRDGATWRPDGTTTSLSPSRRAPVPTSRRSSAAASPRPGAPSPPAAQGTSTLLHLLITGLALAYSAEEVELYLIDFKRRIDLSASTAAQLAHARVVAVESERQAALRVLESLDAELTRRANLFRSAGVAQIADYRAKVEQSLPRILLLVDKFQEFLVEDDAIATQASQTLGRLVREGRPLGIHVLLGS